MARDVGGAERQPGEVEGFLAEHQRGGIGHPGRRAEQPPPQGQHLADRVLSEHLVDRLRRTEHPLQRAVGRFGRGPSTEYDPVGAPAAHERAGWRAGGRLLSYGSTASVRVPVRPSRSQMGGGPGRSCM